MGLGVLEREGGERREKQRKGRREQRSVRGVREEIYVGWFHRSVVVSALSLQWCEAALASLFSQRSGCLSFVSSSSSVPRLLPPFASLCLRWCFWALYATRPEGIDACEIRKVWLRSKVFWLSAYTRLRVLVLIPESGPHLRGL